MVVRFNANTVNTYPGTRGDTMPCVKVSVDLESSDARDMLNSLWDTYGDRWLAEHFEREGYSFIHDGDKSND